MIASMAEDNILPDLVDEATHWKRRWWKLCSIKFNFMLMRTQTVSGFEVVCYKCNLVLQVPSFSKLVSHLKSVGHMNSDLIWRTTEQTIPPKLYLPGTSKLYPTRIEYEVDDNYLFNLVKKGLLVYRVLQFRKKKGSRMNFEAFRNQYITMCVSRSKFDDYDSVSIKTRSNWEAMFKIFKRDITRLKSAYTEKGESEYFNNELDKIT
jgi:hypothetical protein